MNFEDLKDKVAYITGGSRGIGYSIAKTLLKANVKVAISASNKTNAKAAAERLSLESKVYPVWGDISSPEKAKDMVEQVYNKYNRLDYLINNAGITKDNLILRMTDQQWTDVINTNINGVYYTTKATIKYMVKQRYGRIIMISSVVGYTGNFGQVNYCSSKSALIGFTKSLAKELSSRNINCNLIAPGFIKTDMTDKLNQKVKESVLNNIPLAKMGEPKDIANGVIFLCSNMANYITGTTLHINGGLF